MKKRIHSILFILTLTSFVGFAQSNKGSLGEISHSGLHKIELSSEIRSALNDEFKHLRIKDSEGVEVGYVIRRYEDKWLSTFQPVEIASINVLKDSVTSILFENEDTRIQEEITLRIANTRIRKSYSVYGSDGQENWFGLSNNGTLSGLTSNKLTYAEKRIEFPVNDYKYLRIDIDDRKTSPLNILEAGNYTSQFFTKQPVEIKDFRFEIRQNQEKKQTVVKFTAEKTHKLDIIAFQISSNYFQREARIYVEKEKNALAGDEGSEILKTSFQLSSNRQNWFQLRYFNEREFRIVIDNEDNPPLTIDNIQLFQKPVYLVADLKADEEYTVIIDPSLEQPSYDLGNFINENTTIVYETKIKNFKTITVNSTEKVDAEEESFLSSDLFMWLCIVIGSVMIMTFALSLVRDVNKKS